MSNNFFQEENLSEQKFDEVYKSLNEIRGSTYAKNSLRDLIDIGFLKYYGAGLTAFITTNGVIAIEKAFENQMEATEHFPPVCDIELVVIGTLKKL